MSYRIAGIDFHAPLLSASGVLFSLDEDLSWIRVTRLIGESPFLEEILY